MGFLPCLFLAFAVFSCHASESSASPPHETVYEQAFHNSDIQWPSLMTPQAVLSSFPDGATQNRLEELLEENEGGYDNSEDVHIYEEQEETCLVSNTLTYRTFTRARQSSNEASRWVGTRWVGTVRPSPAQLHPTLPRPAAWHATTVTIATTFAAVQHFTGVHNMLSQSQPSWATWSLCTQGWACDR